MIHRRVAISVALALMILLQLSAAPCEAPVAEPGPSAAERAAERVYDGPWQRYQANEPLTPEFLDQLCTWSARRAEAAARARRRDADKAAAVDAHRQRMAGIRKHVNGRHGGQVMAAAIVDYQIAVADEELAVLGAKPQPIP